MKIVGKVLRTLILSTLAIVAVFNSTPPSSELTSNSPAVSDQSLVSMQINK